MCIRYIPGKDNILSDFISRNFKIENKWNVIDACMLELDFVSYDKNDLIAKQLNDEEILQCMKYDCDKVSKINKTFRRYKNKLSVQNGSLKFELHGIFLYICPKELQTEVICLAYDSFWGSHFPAFKTHRRIIEYACFAISKTIYGTSSHV